MQDAKRPDPWMPSISGKTIDLLRPENSVIVLSDICGTLAHICRYGGRVNRFYSVAEHSLLVGELLRDAGCDARTVLGGLLHDAHEAITGDMPSPMKRVLGETWKEFEGQWESHVREQLGISYIWEDPIRARAIAAADLEALATEKAASICYAGDRDWGEAVNAVEPRPWAVTAVRQGLMTSRWGYQLEGQVSKYFKLAWKPQTC